MALLLGPLSVLYKVMAKKHLPKEVADVLHKPNQLEEYEDQAHEDCFEGLLFSEGETDNYYFIARINGKLMKCNLEVELDDDGEIEVSKVMGEFKLPDRFYRKFRRYVDVL